MRFSIKKIAYGLGAEIRGIDATQALDAALVAELRAAWLENLVLVFRDFDITPEQHIAFSRNFGALAAPPNKYALHDSYPELVHLTNRVVDGKPSDTARVGNCWHSDGAFTLRPPTGSLLHCRAIPDVGGDTWFTNMYMAYETLSETMRGIVDQLEVVCDISKAGYRKTARAMEQLVKDLPPVVQRMVRVHPETGRRALYLSESVSTGVVGMSAAESTMLLEFLFKHAVRPELTFRHRWHLNDLVMWDNRCTQHFVPHDYDFSQLREMNRTTLTGEPSGRPYRAALA
jgi:taurine dioxygenase